MTDLPAPVAVVCHDAGAANLILPWAAADPERVLPVMEGPARILWRRRFGDAATFALEDAIGRASSALTGTGWSSDLEHRARKLGKQRGIPTVAVLDHWVNYRERFVRDGEQEMPDAIWVTDEYALELAEEMFSTLKVELKPNLYLREQLAKAPQLTDSDQEVLFVAEPVRSNWGRDIPGEFQALDFFVAKRSDIGIPASAPIRIRPHPSDPPGKYDGWINAHPGTVLDRSDDLSRALGGARWVAGCESYALVVALGAGRTAISALPPWAPPCRLPHSEIILLARS